MGRRTLLLVAALVVAVLGTVLVWMYAQNVKNEADFNNELVTVVVAGGDIAAGTKGSDAANNGLFVEKQVPRSDLVNGALGDPAPLADLVAVVPIYTGQQIIAQQWGTAASITGLQIPDGKIAMSLTLGDPQRVAGFVVPGSTVAIFATGGPAVRTLLSDITVLAVGSTTINPQPSASGTQNSQAASALLTLAVTEEEAQKIIAAQGAVSDPTYTGLYFALMNDTSELTVGGPGVSGNQLFR